MATNTIQVIKYVSKRQEALAGGTITPGMLIERTSSDTFQAHSNAGQPAARLFAVEDELQGNAISDDYSSGDLVQAEVCDPGDVVYALLAAGENVAIGAFLESDGAGAFQAYAAGSAGEVEYPASILAIAREAVDNSASGATVTRILIEII